MFSFITIILEDEHGLSLGILIHVKCMHELCSLLPHILTHLHVIRCYIHVCIDFEDSLNDLLLCVYNTAELKTPILIIFVNFRDLAKLKRS
jgi:hypothetical protein